MGMKKELASRKIVRGDLFIIFFVCALVLFGTIMIFSASYYPSVYNGGNPYFFLKRQLLWVVAGSVAMFVCAKVDYHVWAKLWLIVPVVCLLLLIAVLTPLGRSGAYGDNMRWIPIGPITIMPGELAKVGIIFFVSGYFTKYPKRPKSFLLGVIPVVAVGGLYGLLIMLQPNMSTAATVCFIAGGMLIIGGMRFWQTMIIAGAATVAGMAYIFIDDDGAYRYKRVLSFLDPFEDALGNGWQVVQSLLALGTGGLFGKGLGNSVQKTLYLPMAQNDFILAIVGEELGFFGVFILATVYILLIWRGFHTAMNAKDYFGMMLASGIVLMLAVQVVLNFAVVTSSMPPTGVILPFMSYGGNALLIFMSAFGVLYNISKSADV